MNKLILTTALFFSFCKFSAQSDAVLIRNINYILKDQVCLGKLKLFKNGFSFEANIDKNILFSQNILALKNITKPNRNFQINITDLAFGLYVLEFESSKQSQFVYKHLTDKKSLFNLPTLESIGGEIIKTAVFNLGTK